MYFYYISQNGLTSVQVILYERAGLNVPNGHFQSFQTSTIADGLCQCLHERYKLCIQGCPTISRFESIHMQLARKHERTVKFFFSYFENRMTSESSDGQEVGVLANPVYL